MTIVGNYNLQYSLFSPGQLKWSMTIIEKTGRDNIDGNGFPIDGWQDKFKLRCFFATQSTREAIMADRDNDKPLYKFICRKRDGIDEKLFINFKNKIYDIQHVHILDDFFLEITATEYLGE